MGKFAHPSQNSPSFLKYFVSAHFLQHLSQKKWFICYRKAARFVFLLYPARRNDLNAIFPVFDYKFLDAYDIVFFSRRTHPCVLTSWWIWSIQGYSRLSQRLQGQNWKSTCRTDYITSYYIHLEMGMLNTGTWNLLEVSKSSFSQKDVLYCNYRESHVFMPPTITFLSVLRQLDMLRSWISPFWIGKWLP